MYPKRVNFHPFDIKRQILIADDELSNRMMLAHVLGEKEYEIIFACDGAETIETIRQNKDTLSLILLDVLMPVMTGLEVLKLVREDEVLSHIPIIVTTSEKETEIASLNLGAIDFIPKPYPMPGVIEARVKHAIELSEDRDIIQLTEREELTGLFSKEYFYRYAEQLDHSHKDMEMDAVIVDVDHFHMINERYGRDYGDEVLRRIAKQLQLITMDNIGIVCRKDADTFFMYGPHRDDYDQLLEQITAAFAEEQSSENRIRLRMGIYSNVDKETDIERRFDRAKNAADTVKGSFTKKIGYYSESMHDRQIYEEQLIEDFPTAIAENQFKVLYQPKFDIRPDTPVPASAEALVRWIHPELGMISPGVFIPLFEENGLIQQMDTFVWRETARQVREWKDRLGSSLPVSVNVSRVDMFNPHLAERLGEILQEFDLTGDDIFLELTESAYAEEQNHIIETVEKLRRMGFTIEMDDFGTGYSTLNMISSLPVDALKIDMNFVREAFRPGGNSHMLEVIIGISKFLDVPVIAEGVEEEYQLQALRRIGCDLVQGYYFSKPVSASEFETFILQKQKTEQMKEAAAAEKSAKAKESDDEAAAGKQSAAQDGLDSDKRQLITPIESEEAVMFEESESPESEKSSGISLKTAAIIFLILALIASAALMISDMSLAKGYQRMEEAGERYIEAQKAATDLELGSDYLTESVRSFVVTGDIQYLKDFEEEVNVTKRRDHAVEDMETLMAKSDQEALGSLNKALALSNELIKVEQYAMRLELETKSYDRDAIPKEIRDIELTPQDKALSPQEKQQKAQAMVFNDDYMDYKRHIRENVSECTESLIHSSSTELQVSSKKLARLVNLQTALTIALLLLVLAIILFATLMVRVPLTNMVAKMQEQMRVSPSGITELRFVTRIYNKILHENEQAKERLKHEASHDALTGLFNRGAYDLLMESADQNHLALLLLDIDYFKEVNDTYGHAVGDKVLKRVAEVLHKNFRSVDILCRIGGDEFAVVMTRVDSTMRQIVLNKVTQINETLQNPQDDIPPVTLSVGVAFSDRENPQGDIFTDADDALYRVKKAGRNGCVIY